MARTLRPKFFAFRSRVSNEQFHVWLSRFGPFDLVSPIVVCVFVNFFFVQNKMVNGKSMIMLTGIIFSCIATITIWVIYLIVTSDEKRDGDGKIVWKPREEPAVGEFVLIFSPYWLIILYGLYKMCSVCLR